MSLMVVLYLTLLLVSSGYAVGFGGWEGRWAIALLGTATVATWLATRLNHKWDAFNLYLFAVDAAFFLTLYALALRSRRYWPIWFAGFQLLAVASHFSVVALPDIDRKIYRGLETVWAVPMLVTMVIGITKDRRIGRRTKVARNE